MGDPRTGLFRRDAFDAHLSRLAVDHHASGRPFGDIAVWDPAAAAVGVLVWRIASRTYRPCCDNSTFFQDCNHGSAALAVIALGVAQGLSDDAIYRTLLAFNSYWFTATYVETALYINVVKGTDWSGVDPSLVLSRRYSTASGWQRNVHVRAVKVPNLLPKAEDQGESCGA